jgi:NADH:quinone reductase (non-electrogenic)
VTGNLQRIVIVGGGAGGLELATRLGRKLGKTGLAEVTLVDAELTHIWKPLLHEVAAGSLDASRDELNYMAQATWNGFDYEYGRMDGLDRARKRLHLAPQVDLDGVQLAPARTLAYDTLVLAVGSMGNDFGTPGVREHAIFLDTREQAEALRRRLRDRFIAARSRDDGIPVRVAVVGAGATGVELSAELRDAANLYRHYAGDAETVKLEIFLLEAGTRVLPAVPERIGHEVTTRLREEFGVQVHTGCPVRRVEAGAVYAGNDQRFPADLVVWAAGIRAPSFLHELDGLETNRVDQLVVDATLATTRDPSVFAFGDCAACPLGDGHAGTVPARAQAAHQQASLLAANFIRQTEHKPMLPFVYKDHGSLVSLASHAAIGDLFGGRMVEGKLARLVYVSLYRLHQAALYGWMKTGLLVLAGLLTRGTRPLLKLH